MTSSALQIQGDNTGSTYAATANGSGSFTVNVEAADGSLGNNQDFTYSLHATDTFGNQTTAVSVTAADQK